MLSAPQRPPNALGLAQPATWPSLLCSPLLSSPLLSSPQLSSPQLSSSQLCTSLLCSALLCSALLSPPLHPASLPAHPRTRVSPHTSPDAAAPPRARGRPSFPWPPTHTRPGPRDPRGRLTYTDTRTPRETQGQTQTEGPPDRRQERRATETDSPARRPPSDPPPPPTPRRDTVTRGRDADRDPDGDTRARNTHTLTRTDPPAHSDKTPHTQEAAVAWHLSREGGPACLGRALA